jgi:hypothetical protein
MEIDLPRGPIHSVKDFFIHIFTITVGILIALGLEQAIVAYHHRELANEARANIISELRDNKHNLDESRRGIPKLIKQPELLLSLVNEALAHRLKKTPPMELHFALVTTTSTSWTTAQAVGALTYMNYQEVKDFSETYQLQQRFEDVQKTAFEATIAAISAVGELKVGMEKWSTQDLENARQQLQRCSAADQVFDQFAKALSDEYAEVLSKHVSK